ncbi:hypothetical protein HO173_008194 [Letharia columbiana]|uniref:FHA domain-containing protein n=1 Tax=Letharia columbiana TaxID=112416 RepID=A0A8H6FS32_9LECA|nr:uncharacterized protein HO173_008194 [Letharia columbiana]KAF6233637.1 hypothetical protein HO173_008194 [Letharia columbiana]
MTAVASPPSFQPRWNAGSGVEGPMSAEEVTRMFMPRKGAQRTNSASSTTSSASSSTFTSPAPAPQTNGDTPTANGEQGGWGPKKKAASGARGLWPSSKAEPVSGLSTARSQALPTPSSGQSAASTMNTAMHQPSPVLPSQNRLQSQAQQNGGRGEQQTTGSGPSPAILALLPMTGTFERKQITVPFSPDFLRIGRQTNAKTVPTPVNGYFDSKVLSRQHAEVWADKETGKIWIKDVKSSNGTFVNGVRLSAENRDSEPHELREQDTLELGIDIVSEDQKSIVHHKVSAKVELAGIYPNPPSLLEMDFSANTSSGGNAMMGEPMSQQMSQMRGRGGSQGSVGSNGRMTGPSSMAGGNSNMLGPQRQMNLWMGPITIEQVVKKLGGELKQAKQQSQDLHRTGDFFNTLLTLQPGEQPPNSPPKHITEENKTNGVHPPSQVDIMSPFSQPPAPPPQHPLPEKPDSARFTIPDSLSQPSLKRVDTERPKSGLNSPTKEIPSGQIVSLLEALKSAKQEIDSQGSRVKHLEVALARERKARELAERRARTLSGSQDDHETNGTVEEEAFEPPLDTLELIEHELPNGHAEDDEESKLLPRSISTATLKSAEDMHQGTVDIDTSTSRLQARIDLMVKEMDDLKFLMESYKQRAEDAEEGQRGLAEMVESIRAGRDSKSVMPTTNDEDSTLLGNGDIDGGADSKGPTRSKGMDRSSSSSHLHHQLPNGTAAIEDMHRELEKTVSNVLQQQRQWGSTGEGGRIVQSAPYVSMVGVVLIGVGIMTWLNGWQPGGER